jgi:hypothetical protein
MSKYIENKYKLIDRLIEEEKKLSSTDQDELLLKAPLLGNVLIQIGNIQSIKIFLEERGEKIEIPEKYNEHLKMITELFFVDKDNDIVYNPTKAKVKDLLEGIKMKKGVESKKDGEKEK